MSKAFTVGSIALALFVGVTTEAYAQNSVRPSSVTRGNNYGSAKHQAATSAALSAN